MGSTRAGAGGESTGRGADLLTSAASLRWTRPDLTGALADHVLEMAAIAGDQDRWLAAAGWAVHARSATGDGRETASNVMGELSRWGRAPLDSPAARRLRIELALVAAGAGEVEVARGLLGPVVVDDTEPELQADLLSTYARCAVEDAPERVADALRAADAAWSAVPGPAGQVGAASVALISAVVERRNRRPDDAADYAADGLTRLERGRGAEPSGTPSGHLAAALAAEWISALLDAGRADEARDGCVPLMPRLAEPARPSRQLALLRLTVARAVAVGDAAGSSIGLLEQAADDAAASDAPDLESVCRTALGALHEQAGQIDTALETLRRGVAAERRDRSRIARFRSALAELPAGTLRVAPAADESGPGSAGLRESATDRIAERAVDRPADRTAGRATHRSAPEPAAAASGYDWEQFLRDAESAGRESAQRAGPQPPEPGGGKRRRREDEPRENPGDDSRGPIPSRLPQRPAEPEPSEPSWRSVDRSDDAPEPTSTQPGADWVTSRWDEPGESPIGDLVFRSLHSEDGPGEEEPGAGGGHRNGSNGSNGRRARDGGEGRHESPPPEAPRNGRSRSGERSGTWAESVSWDFASEQRGSELDRARPEDSPRSHRRSAGGDEERLPFGDIGGDGRTGRSSHRSDAEPRDDGRINGRDSASGGGAGGRRHRADDPWSTFRRPSAESAAAPGAEDTAGPAHLSPSPPAPATEPATGSSTGRPVTPARGADDPESWLRAALADLDRVWGPAGPGAGSGLEPSQPADAPSPSTPATRATEEADNGWAVVIDVARDGRRFAGRRAGAVVRAVADRITDRLPQGARLRLGEPDALSITLPGWDQAAATDWMHRTLPGLLADFDAGEDLPAAQLRAAVHDAEGPVGAQILQSLERPTGRSHGAGADRSSDHLGTPERWSDVEARHQDAGSPGHAAGREARPWEATPKAPKAAAPEPDRQDWGYDVQAGSDRAAERSHRHSAGAAAEAAGVSGTADGGGSRHGNGPDAEPGEGRETTSAERAAAGQAESTEGLGIADLLAGALAAYRSI